MYRNKVVTETYEPGSVFKTVMASVGLEEDVVETDTAGDFYCSGSQIGFWNKNKLCKQIWAWK